MIDDLADAGLFDGDDVDAGGIAAPAGTALTGAEIAAIRAGQAAGDPDAANGQGG